MQRGQGKRRWATGEAEEKRGTGVQKGDPRPLPETGLLSLSMGKKKEKPQASTYQPTELTCSQRATLFDCNFLSLFSLKPFKEATLLTELPTHGKNGGINVCLKTLKFKKTKNLQKSAYSVHCYADFANTSLIQGRAIL